MSDEPIDPQDYRVGVTVVDIGDIRVARGMTRRPTSTCRHLSIRYDPKERRVWCSDCEKDVDAFDAFELLVSRYSAASKDLQKQRERVAEAEKFQARTLAAKALDEAWRSRNMVPACPTCGHGLFPEDFKRGVPASLGREYAEAKRAKHQQDRKA